jgi:Zn-dependent peptidase ImmA (M78 family)
MTMPLPHIEIPEASKFNSHETIDLVALKFNQAFRDQSKNKLRFPLDIDRFVDWLEVSILSDNFEEPEGASFFASYSPDEGGKIYVNEAHRQLFDKRPDVYLACIAHETGHHILRHIDTSSLNKQSCLFGDESSSPKPLLHKSSWNQYGLSADEVKKRQEELRLRRNQWVKEALINPKARQALDLIDNHFEPEWMFRQAEQFSRCFCIPRDCLFEILEEIVLVAGWQPIYKLAEHFGVSATTMKLRLLKLELIEIGADGKPYPISRHSQSAFFDQ